MKQSPFDRWLTTQPEPNTMHLITADDLTNDEEGLRVPQHIDELRCEHCAAPVGWCSEGSFTDFFTDESDQHNLCSDCCDNLESNEQ